MIKSLKRDVLSYKYYNDNLMKYQEYKNGFNITLLRRLDRIDKKVDKEIYSSNSKDHISHAKKEKYRIFGGHHHHSPRHSVTREKNSSRLYLVRNHKGGQEWMKYKGR
jgi:hypothetical protein